MRILEKTAHFLGEEEGVSIGSWWQILGPLFILCTFSLDPRDPLILSVGVAGLLLSARWRIRGFSYALLLLGAAAVAEHAFFSSRHLWQLGLEGSYALAFFITALTTEERSSFVQSLSSQLEARGSSIRNIEEEIAALRETAVSQQIALQERIAVLQKEIEEGESEQSSLLILNEVLRKTTAQEGMEKSAAKEDLLDAQRRLALEQNELEALHKELAHLRDADALGLENRELASQINSARVDKEQARLISETLARLHAKECLRAQEAGELLVLVQEENQKLKDQFFSLKNESESLNSYLEQTSSERDQHRAILQRLEEVQTERNFLKERLERAELELLQRRESSASSGEIAHLQEKVASLAQIEALYKQLRAQFEEKGATLHQTRAELFRADTQLQTLRMEREQRELQVNPISEEMRRELSTLEEELSRLEQENEALEDLVTHLTESPPRDNGKKSEKKN